MASEVKVGQVWRRKSDRIGYRVENAEYGKSIMGYVRLRRVGGDSIFEVSYQGFLSNYAISKEAPDA